MSDIEGPNDIASGDASEDRAPVDALEGLAIIKAQRAVVRDGAEPDASLLFGLWGVAWLVGYLALYLTARDAAEHAPAAWAFVVFGSCIVGAIALTIVHVVRRTSGVRGVSAASGAMYGMSWTIGFVAIVLIMTRLDRAGAGPEVLALGWNALPCFLVGVLYLAGGALWQSKVVYALGTWIALVVGAATVVGLPDVYLVMALAGGGGMLAGALVERLVRNRRRS